MSIQQRVFLAFFLIMTVFLGGLYAYAFRLPSTWRVESAIVIEAPPGAVWPRVSDLGQWDGWHPWTAQRDASLKLEVRGKPGVGQERVFMGNAAGRGRMLVTGFEPDASIAYDLEFVGTDPSKRTITVTEVAGGHTRIVWTDAGAMSGVLDRFAIDHIKAGMEYDMKLGLEKLKSVVEADPASPSEGELPAGDE